MKRTLSFLLLLFATWSAFPIARADEKRAATTPTPTPLAPTPIAPATLSIADASTREGTNSASRELLFPVTLSRALPYDVSASFVTKPITAQPLSDYTSRPAGQIVIKAGQTRATVLVRIIGDQIEERDESFLVQLGAPKRCAISDSDAIGSIKDDDYGGQISVANLVVPELQEGQKNARILVSLSQAPLHDIAVEFATRDDSAKASDGDYIATRGTLLFHPGRRVLSVEVPVVGDTKIEGRERFWVQIGAPGLALSKALGEVGLINDDVELSLSPGTVSEARSDGTTDLRFTLSLSQPASSGLGISYQTANGSAKSGSDYVATRGDVGFKVGQKNAGFTIPIVGDTFKEGDETFFVRVIVSFGFGEGPQVRATFPVTILANDARPPSSGGKIVFQSSRDNRAEIYSINADGTHLTRLTDNDFNDEAPNFSRNGSQIIFVSDRSGENALWVMNADGSNPRLVLTLGDPVPLHPEFSPDGSQIAFSVLDSVGGTDNSTLYVMSAADGGTRVVASDLFADSDFGFSPDGKQVVYNAITPDHQLSMSRINLDGSGQTALNQGNTDSYSPRYTPAGTRIAFLAPRTLSDASGGASVVFQPFAFGLDGSGKTLLTPQSDAALFNFCFSPDGTRIAYTQVFPSPTPGGAPIDQIRVMQADGSQARQIAFGFGPDWAPGSVPAPPAAPNSAATSANRS